MGYKNKSKYIFSAAVLTLVLGSSAYVYFFLANTKTDFTSQAATCTVSSLLVNSCRPWLGAAVDGYPQVAGDKAAQFAYAEKRLNDPEVLTNPGKAVTVTRKLDFVHFFHPVGNDVLTSTEKSYINRANTYAIINWKPTDTWADADGTNTAVNQRINTIADSIKSVAPKKIIFTLYHEPEDNVSVRPKDACKDMQLNSTAKSGSPAQYRKMWQTVREKFNARGVTNVVWGMNYMGYTGWDCLVPYLWPGNGLVDWVLWDPYAHGTIKFETSINRFYTYLSTNSNAEHNYASKPWGIAEHGFGNKNDSSTQEQAEQYWVDAKTAIVNNRFPKLKLYTVFDTSVNGDSQVGRNFTNTASRPAEQAKFNSYAAAMQAIGQSTTGGGTTGGGTTGGGTTGGGTTGGGTTGGTTSGTTSGTVRSTTGQSVVSGRNSSNVTSGQLLTLNDSTVTDPTVIAKITKVEFYLDDVLYQTITEEPFALDTTEMEPGSYTIKQVTYFEDGTSIEEVKVIEVAGAEVTNEEQAAGASIWQVILMVTIILLVTAGLLFILAWLLYWRPRGYSLGESVGMVTYPVRQALSFRRSPKIPDYTDNDIVQISPTVPPSQTPPSQFTQPPSENSHKFPWV